MKKKLMLSAAAVAMVGTLAVGGTLAWFTDTETATNVITTGYVDVMIRESLPTEEQQEEGGYTAVVQEGEEGISYSGIEPGTVIDKNPVIYYDGSADAYVRYKIDVLAVKDYEIIPIGDKVKYYKVNEETGEKTAVTFDEDAYVYSTEVYEEDEVVAELFDQIEFANCGNEIADARITINIVADAIQADNLPMAGDTITVDDIAAAFGDAEVNGVVPEYDNDLAATPIMPLN